MGTLNYLLNNRGYLTPEKRAVRKVNSRDISPFFMKKQQISYKKRDGATNYIVSPELERPRDPMKHAKFEIKKTSTEGEKEPKTIEESRISEHETLTHMIQEKLAECRKLVEAYRSSSAVRPFGINLLKISPIKQPRKSRNPSVHSQHKSVLKYRLPI